MVSLFSSNTSFHAANNELLYLSKFIAIFHYLSHTVNGLNNKLRGKIWIKHRQATDSQSSFWTIDKKLNEIKRQFLIELPFSRTFCSLPVFSKTVHFLKEDNWYKDSYKKCVFILYRVYAELCVCKILMNVKFGRLFQTEKIYDS